MVGGRPLRRKSLGDLDADARLNVETGTFNPRAPRRRGMNHLAVGTKRLELVRGNILDEQVDALVTAANSGLRGGGGVDGAVHRAAGPALLAACREVGGCPTGDAVATAPGALELTCVVHAVGPIFGQHGGEEDALLASAHRRALEVAAAAGAASVAFPAISCGVYGYPLDRAAPVALSAVVAFLETHDEIDLVRYVLFGAEEYGAFEQALSALIESRG